MHSEEGAVAVWVAIMLPAIVAAMAFVYDLAWLTIMKNNLQLAADYASLAAMQELDMEQLALGHCVLLAEPAYGVASQFAWANLNKCLSDEDMNICTISIRIYQAGDPGQHGDRLKDGSPSVCVRIELPARLPISGVAYTVKAHADASVTGKF